MDETRKGQGMNQNVTRWDRVMRPAPQSKRPRTGRGLFTEEEEKKRNLVPAAAEVEAVDQLAADRLHVLFRVLDADQSHGRECEEARVFGAIAGVTILGFPVQAGDQVEAVFIAAAEEPALVLLCVHRNTGRRARRQVRKGDALEASLGVTAGDVSQQPRNHHVADTAANSPGILLL